MGRKGDFAEKVKKGPGRKTKKQGDPSLQIVEKRSNKIQYSGGANNESKKLSSHQKQRAKKRAMKIEAKQKLKINKKNSLKDEKVQSEDEEEIGSAGEDLIDSSEEASLEEKDESSGDESAASEESETIDMALSKPVGFTDDNKEWLKPKLGKRKNATQEDDSDTDESIDEDAVSEEDTDNESDDHESGDDESEDSDAEGNDDEEMLPIEKAAKKLEKKQKKDAKLAEQEMKLNMAERETFTLPSGQDVEREALQAPDLQIIQTRVKDVIEVLKDFTSRREEGRSRHEYLECLKRDLCSYYNYNDYMMGKLIDTFNVTDIVDVLEANEVQRPVTIRTNSLKIRRRDLAQALINRGVNLDPVGKLESFQQL